MRPFPKPSQTDWPASMTLHLITQRESIFHLFWQLGRDKSTERWPEQGVENNAPDYQIGFHWTLNISCSTSNRGHADGLNKWQTYMSITRRLPPHPLGQAPGIMSGSYFQSHQPCVSCRPPNTETTLQPYMIAVNPLLLRCWMDFQNSSFLFASALSTV